ncbi:unnamed protein product [Dicrocoelium dendriticum]|nr:unnamed protein product [Dicrocoelium dendriticum]
MFNDASQFCTLSKHHFKIFMEPGGHCSTVFIQDLSSNGTFVNGSKLGRGIIQPLNNNDEISLSLKDFKCFIFWDPNSVRDSHPREVTDHYTVSKLIGRGACGEVRLAFEKNSCIKRAMKIVHKKTFAHSKSGNAFVHRVQSEVDILLKLSHPCIIRIHDVIDTADTLYMILELVEGGELFDRIITLGKLSEPDVKFLFVQIAIAVKYLHEHGITHRDLKPENILLSSSENRCLIKVTDFGLSKLVDGNTMLRTFCGTPTYLAPEVLLTAGSGTYTSAIDVWSLGVILYVCLVGYPPFSDERQDCCLHTQITEGRYDFPAAYWNGISDDARDLISKMLTVEPSDRLTIQAVLEHRWVRDPEIWKEVDALISNTESSTSESIVPCIASGPHFLNGYESSEQFPQSNSAPANTDFVHQDQAKLLRDKPLIRKRLTDLESPVPKKILA